MDNSLLTIKNLSFSLSNQLPIIDDVSFVAKHAQSIALLGPNGAGKSTLLKIISSYLSQNNGHVELGGIDSQVQRCDFLKMVGYMPEVPLILPELTVKEQLQLVAQLKNSQVADDLIEQCQLQPVVDKRCNHLSLGYKQRLNLAQALLTQPKLLIMDEPLNGLDPHLIVDFRTIIQQLKKHTIIIMSTHYLAEAQSVSDRVLIMQQGRLLDDVVLDEDTDLEKLYMQHTRTGEMR